ncbi:unnamed protein product [Protopolystoma xenopodis]|uniref:Uncharacterized protein n=1 Tax=Protopolystoma xenopodis TaxID=117903 RepID=A0A3S5FDV7_9PLAT|nr:unnamed protein product [Protopolystoma xenopodis]
MRTDPKSSPDDVFGPHGSKARRDYSSWNSHPNRRIAISNRSPRPSNFLLQTASSKRLPDSSFGLQYRQKSCRKQSKPDRRWQRQSGLWNSEPNKKEAIEEADDLEAETIETKGVEDLGTKELKESVAAEERLAPGKRGGRRLPLKQAADESDALTVRRRRRRRRRGRIQGRRVTRRPAAVKTRAPGASLRAGNNANVSVPEAPSEAHQSDMSAHLQSAEICKSLDRLPHDAQIFDSDLGIGAPALVSRVPAWLLSSE